MLPAAFKAVRRVPVAGALVRRSYYAGRAAARSIRTRSVQAWSDFWARREYSAKNVVRQNTRRSYDKLYRSDALLADYLRPERMRFYEEVASWSAVVMKHVDRPRVIDAGCGSGHLLEALSKRIEVGTLAGVDHSAEAIFRARGLLPAARWVVADLYSLEAAFPNERFDLLLCTEVLEHLERPRDALLSLAAVCSEGGRIVVTVPDGAFDDWEGHVNFWTEEELWRFLAEFGQVDIERVDGGATLLAVITPTRQLSFSGPA